MSTGGVYRTEDGGASLDAPATPASRRYFLPDPLPEFGQCVHKVARDPADPDRLYAQNHHGVYRSDDDGATWTSIADGLPTDFGFAMVAHPRRPGTIYNFPLDGGRRALPAGRAGAGSTAPATPARPGRRCREGCRQEPFYPAVLRDAMCADDADPAGVYFGTRSGEVYASRDEGDSWPPDRRAPARRALRTRGGGVMPW